MFLGFETDRGSPNPYVPKLLSFASHGVVSLGTRGPQLPRERCIPYFHVVCFSTFPIDLLLKG
jgi:hypothetical protein